MSRLALALIAIGLGLCIEASWLPLGWSMNVSKDAQLIVGAMFLLGGALLIEVRAIVEEVLLADWEAPVSLHERKRAA